MLDALICRVQLVGDGEYLAPGGVICLARGLPGQPGEGAHGDGPEFFDAQRHGGKPGTGRWQLLKAGQMLDDGNAGGKQQRVRGPLAVGGVVDVERVDADECDIMISEPGCARPGQEVPALGVGR